MYVIENKKNKYKLKDKDEEIDSSNAQLSDLVGTKYPSAVKTLESSAETMQKTKSEYENKALLLSDKDRHMQTEQYEIEFLWTKIGNHAKDNDVDIKIEVTASQISGRYDLNFTVTGDYPDVTQFIYDIENDSKLGFKVEKFKMKPEEALVVTYDGKGQIFCQKKES